jgi:hypothetical protein
VTFRSFSSPEELTFAGFGLASHVVLRVIDSFVFLISGSKAPLPSDWYKTQKWNNVVVIGAVASINGNDALLAQSGRFDKIVWRWVVLRHISGAMISSDCRFRKRYVNVKQGATRILTGPVSRACG